MRPRAQRKPIAARVPSPGRGIVGQIAYEVDQIPREMLRSLYPALLDAQRELARGLDTWLARADGEARFTAQQMRAALLNVQGAIDKIDQLEPEFAHTLGTGAVRSSVLGRDAIARQYKAYARQFEGLAAHIPILPAARLAYGADALMPRYRSSAARYSTAVQQDIRHQLAIGVAKGETIGQLTNRLQRAETARPPLRYVASTPSGPLVVSVPMGERIAGGLFGKYRYWAERLVRTEVLEVFNAQADASIADLQRSIPDVERQWDASLDYRTCAICRTLDRVVVPVGAMFPGGIDRAPAHPCCRCTIVAFRRAWAADGAPAISPRDVIMPLQTRAKPPGLRLPSAPRAAPSLASA